MFRRMIIVFVAIVAAAVLVSSGVAVSFLVGSAIGSALSYFGCSDDISTATKWFISGMGCTIWGVCLVSITSDDRDDID